ncbi:MAG: hypothetical protein RMI90_03570, partial [Thermoguttaceae bacterium]|nr:hypothetical protein [Thermoguttaceae bacterium]
TLWTFDSIAVRFFYPNTYYLLGANNTAALYVVLEKGHPKWYKNILLELCRGSLYRLLAMFEALWIMIKVEGTKMV